MPRLRELRITNAQRARQPRTEDGGVLTVVAGRHSAFRTRQDYRVVEVYGGRRPDFSDTCWLKLEGSAHAG